MAQRNSCGLLAAVKPYCALVTKSRYPGGAHEHVAHFVREAIRAGRWTAGEAVDVTALASELSISPSPVREGLARLRGEGMLGTRHRDGYSMPLLQAHELVSEYRFIALVAPALVLHVHEPAGSLALPAAGYAGRMETLLISLGQLADLPTAALRLHQSALRIFPYMMVEPDVLPTADADLAEMEAMLVVGDKGVGQVLERHFAECITMAPTIARVVFEQSERFESAFR